MTVDTRLFTADELLDMPADGWRYELVRGELRKMPFAGVKEGAVSTNMGASLYVFVSAHDLGTVYAAGTGFILARNPDTVLAPDASFVRSDRDVDTDGYYPGPPDLAVEVISPNDRFTDVEEKTAEWLRAGVRAAIVVDPRRRSVKVHRSSGFMQVDDVLEVEDVVPGWRFPLSELFA